MTEPTNDAVPSALILRRLAAFCYDILVMTGLLMIATFPYLWLLQWTAGTDEVSAGDPAYRFYLAALVFGYVWISWRRGGQTIGMKAWRLRAETLDGQPLSSSQIGLRFLAAVPSLLLFGIGYLWSFLRADRRSLPEVFSDSRTRYLPK